MHWLFVRVLDSVRLAAALGLLIMGLTGCESLQRKLTRKPKPYVRPTPVIHFQDYTHAMTPLDRYRKHYLMFDYWNGQLVDELASQSANLKRLREASGEALKELQTLQGLLQDPLTAQMGRLIQTRTRIDQQLGTGSASPPQCAFMQRVLETQTRQIHREFFWKNITEHLKENPPSDASPH